MVNINCSLVRWAAESRMNNNIENKINFWKIYILWTSGEEGGWKKKLIKLLIFRFTIVYITQIISKHNNTHRWEKCQNETLKNDCGLLEIYREFEFLNFSNNNIVRCCVFKYIFSCFFVHSCILLFSVFLFWRGFEALFLHK